MAKSVPKRYLKTYSDIHRKIYTEKSTARTDFVLFKNPLTNKPIVESKILSTKRAIELLLEGSLKKRVCRFCLCIATPLSELDQLFQVAGNKGSLYKVSLRDMIATFHPLKIEDDEMLPSNICNKCIDSTLSAYLFIQQCEQAGRAIRNCFDDVLQKLDKLDSLHQSKKRGRQKQCPNYNKIHVGHNKVIDFAEPLINMINRGSIINSKQHLMQLNNNLECLKCCEILPNIESLMNHEKSHPSSMWYNCRLCGKSFPKRSFIKRHLRRDHLTLEMNTRENKVVKFQCCYCNLESENYILHLQHIEKHKFKDALENIIKKRNFDVCTICFTKYSTALSLDETFFLHGGFPGVTGNRSLREMLATSLLWVNSSHDYIGTKICCKCAQLAITSFLFINNSVYSRYRFDTCVSSMLDKLNQLHQPNGNIFIEICKTIIMPEISHAPSYEPVYNDEETDENKYPVEVLEDEFRKSSEDEDNEICADNESVKGQSSKSKSNISQKSITLNKRDDGHSMQIELPNGYDAAILKRKSTKLNNVNYIYKEFLTFKHVNKHRKSLVRFTCYLCCKHFVSGYHLRKHVSKHIYKRIRCEVCGFAFQTNFALYEHKKNIHFLKKICFESCTVCSRTFNSKLKLKIHFKSHFMKLCLLCNKCFKSQKYFDSHMQRHFARFNIGNGSHIITCSFCAKQFKSRTRSALHLNKVHLRTKPYSCDMCDKQYFAESNLKEHKKIHNLPAKEMCVFCDKNLGSRKQLVMHIRKHIRVKNSDD